MSERPHRLEGFSYKGLHRYSLTFCGYQRRILFVRAHLVQEALAQILQSAALRAFSVCAYCFMPDHLHLLVAGQTVDADLICLAKDVKQRVAYHCFPAQAGLVWQKGYYDHVLRDDEATLVVARYILANPVRAGLSREPRDYPFSGSAVWTWDQLVDLWQMADDAVVNVGGCGTA
jgi:REP-associated tyrosine transposase